MLGGSVLSLDMLDDILGRLKQVENLDLRPLGEQIRGILIQDNREALMAGIDGNGRPFAPLAASTLEHRRGSALPGSWRAEAGSALIGGFEVEIDVRPGGQLLIEAGWNNSAPQARYFSEGTAHQPPRKLDGLRPETQEKITVAVDEFAKEVVGP